MSKDTTYTYTDKRIKQFAAKGTGYLSFLQLAAQPLLFSTDLLYKLWLNFSNYASENDVPCRSYLVVSDLILSGICRPIGFNLFSLEEDIREEMCNQLDLDNRKTVSNFVYEYAEHNKSLLSKNIYGIYRIWAMGILDPMGMEDEIKKKIKEASTDHEKVNYLSLYYNSLPLNKLGKDKTSITLEIADTPNEKNILNVRLPLNLRNKVSNQITEKHQHTDFVIGLIAQAEKEAWSKLDLSGRQISQIRNLDRLTNLTSLNLNNNQISDISGLEKLANLTSLDLSNNQISEIKGFDRLTNLTSLDLSNNQISEIKGFDRLTNLTSLDLSNNQINEIKGFDRLVNLTSLDLSNNQISDISGLEQLTQLSYFNLSKNPIKYINKALEIDVLDLSSTALNDLSVFVDEIAADRKVLWEQARARRGKSKAIADANFIYHGYDYHAKKAIYVKDCHNLKKPAPEWIMLGSNMVKQYFEAIEEQGEEELNEVKVLLVGDGGAGKTSLAYRLAQPKADLPIAEKRTRGIEIYDWKYTKNRKKYHIHLWDFGGQVMYDMVHQYFYSQQSLYLLLDSSRSGANENDSRLNQLLQSVELFGKGSPMLMIQNEHTGHEKKMDFAQLQKNYPFLKEFCKVNLRSKENLHELKYILKKHIEDIPGQGVVLPKKWMNIRKKIERIAKKEDTLSLERFQKICVNCSVEDEKAQRVLSRYLHQMGVFLHFQDRKESTLQKLIILNRDWATKASYKVFDATFMQEREQKGAFDINDLERFWPEAEFRPFHLELLDLMKQFEICYELPSSKQYIVPRLMDKMPDENYCKGEESPLHLYYEYTFMPEGLLNRLSVRLHEMIGGANREMVWNDGVVFKEKGLLAQVREIRQSDKSRIDIKIIGKDVHWMSEQLIREIDKINEAFNLERLKVEVKIPCNCKQCSKSEEKYFFDFHKVKSDLQKPDRKYHYYVCENSRETVDYHELLKTISHKAVKEIQERQKLNKIDF